MSCFKLLEWNWRSWFKVFLKDELAAFAAAQSNKEQDYVRAREAAEAAAAATARSEANKADKDYTHLATQVTAHHI